MLRESSATTTAPILRGARVSINSSQAFSSVGGGGGGGVGRESVGKRPILIRKKNIASAMGISSENDQDNAEVNDNGKMYSSRDAEAVELYKFLNTQRPVNKNMLVAVQKAEKSHVVRRKLHQFDQRILKAASKRHRSAVINLLSTDYTSSVDVEMAIAEQESNKMSTSNDLQVGYEKLNIMPLEEVDNRAIQEKTNKFQAQMTMEPESQNVTPSHVDTQTMDSVLKRIIDDIKSNSWLAPDEAEQITNIFKAELATRYNNASSLMYSQFTPFQNRLLAVRLFEKLGSIKDAALEKCRKKKSKMDNLHVFNGPMNSERMISSFRTELNRRIHPEKIMKTAIHETLSGRLWVKQQVQVKVNTIKHETQFKEELDSVLRPHAPVEPVQFKYMAEVIQQKINAETEVAHRSAFGEDASKKEPTPDFLSDFRRYGVAQQYKLQQKRLEQQASIRGDYFSGIIGRRNTSFKGRSSSVSEPGNASVVSRELQLNRSYKEDEENAIMERFKEIELEREIFYREKASQQEMEAKSGYSALVRDDPLLQAHTTNDSLMKSKPRENNQILQILKPTERYLNRRRHGENAPTFDFRLLDELCENNPDFEDAMDREESKLVENVTLRITNSKISDRIPKGFISLSEEPVNTVNDLSNEVEDKSINNMDEKLNRFKEVEELYDEIMKTIVGDHLEHEDADDDLIHCPSAPNDAIIETSNAFLGLRPNVDRETLKILPPGGLEELEEEERRMEAQKAAAESEKKASTTAPQQLIRMSTRDADQKPIPADEFIRHRDAAMRKIVSSKYGSFKYNYGGYIPQSIIRKKIEEEQNVLFRLTDYISHLRLYTSDFILDILVDEEAEMEARKIEEEERKRKRKEEEDRERLEQEVAKKLAERKKMLEFSEGMWNPGVMEYLSEIHEKDAAIKKRSPQSGLENYTPDQLRFSLQTPFNTAGGDANMGELLASNRASMVMPPASRRASVAFPPSSSPIMNAAGESRVTTSGGTPSPLGVPVSMVRRTSLALQDTSGFNQRRSSHAAQELAELNNARRTSTAERASVTSIPEGGLDSATIRRTSVSAGHADADALGAETVDVGGAVILEVPEIEGYRNSEVLETDSNGALISEDALNDSASRDDLLQDIEADIDAMAGEDVRTSLQRLEEQLNRLGTQESSNSKSSTESLVDMSKAQTELESLWAMLKMPLDQKLDMAIKYGSAKFAAKVDLALAVWRTTAKLILERESLLLDIEEFERKSTDPDRFFRRGYEGSSEARMEEASQREQLLRRIHSLEAKITDNISTIKNELHETVTFDGAPYTLKMRCDYLDIIEKIQKDRDAGLLPSQQLHDQFHHPHLRHHYQAHTTTTTRPPSLPKKASSFSRSKTKLLLPNNNNNNNHRGGNSATAATKNTRTQTRAKSADISKPQQKVSFAQASHTRSKSNNATK